MKLAIKIKPAKKKMTDEERISEMTDMMSGKMPSDEDEQLLHGEAKNNYQLSKDEADEMDEPTEEMEQDEENEAQAEEFSKIGDEIEADKAKSNRLFKNHPSVQILIGVGRNRRAANG